jgi:hypothetical protein
MSDAAYLDLTSELAMRLRSVMPDESTIDLEAHAALIARTVVGLRTKALVLPQWDDPSAAGEGGVQGAVHAGDDPGVVPSADGGSGKTREVPIPLHVRDPDPPSTIHSPQLQQARNFVPNQLAVGGGDELDVALTARLAGTHRRVVASTFLTYFERIFERPPSFPVDLRPRLEELIEQVGIGAAVELMQERHRGGRRPRSAVYFLPALEERAGGGLQA